MSRRTNRDGRAFGINDDMELVVAPEGTLSRVYRGPSQLTIVTPSETSLKNKRKLICVGFFFFVLLILMIIVIVSIVSGSYFLLIAALPLIATFVLQYLFFRLLWSKAVLEIQGDGFRLSDALRNLSCFKKYSMKPVGGDAWKQFAKAPEIVTKAIEHIANDSQTAFVQNVVCIQLVEGGRVLQFGVGLTSSELHWLLQRINEFNESQDVP